MILEKTKNYTLEQWGGNKFISFDDGEIGYFDWVYFCLIPNSNPKKYRCTGRVDAVTLKKARWKEIDFKVIDVIITCPQIDMLYKHIFR